MEDAEYRGGDVALGDGGGGWSMSTGASALGTGAARWVLRGLLLLGPLLGGAALALASHPAVPAAVRPPAAPPASAAGGQGAAGFAEQFVAVFVAAGDGDQAKLASFYPGATDLRLEGAPGRLGVDQLVVARLRQTDRDVWSVTVGARLTPAGGAGSVHYFQVPVAAAPVGGGATGYVALGMPAEVGAPARVQAPALVYGPWRPALPADPLAQTVTSALSAYLTGAGGLDRYLSPGTQLAPVSPAPYTQVSVDQLAVEGEQDGSPLTVVPPGGTQLRVLVQVRAGGADGVRVPLTYALTLRVRAGRWEVAALDGAPAEAPSPAVASPVPSAPAS